MPDLTENLDSGFLDYEIFPLVEDPSNFCRGENARHLLLATTGGSDPALQDFLEKIMVAVKYDVARDAILFSLTSPAPFSFIKMARRYHFKQAVFFGINPSEAGLKMVAQPYQPLEVAGITYLFCHDLKKIHDEPALKRHLWEALKAMFLN
ncbi:MAG: hypothetical protein H6577_25590 [Lewinellaceae bacterium]|nr:hypothetical protein [Saprospiraceae bacterium]MCB9341510.1 hypothetical protein [Lewinellaceae bacterium]